LCLRPRTPSMEGGMERRSFLLLPLSLALVRTARAQALGAIEIAHPWAKPSVTEAAALFVEMTNWGPRPDRLLGGETPVADRMILRQRSGEAAEYFELQPRRAMHLRPGRRYIALRELKAPLALDDTFPVTFHFAEAGTITLTAIVEAGAEE
jgi:copper(I)-binding protein